LRIGGETTATEIAGVEASSESESGATDESQTSTAALGDSGDEIKFANEMIAAVTPVVLGPAFQVLPLAICA
jgi:hypothetical protein